MPRLQTFFAQTFLVHLILLPSLSLAVNPAQVPPNGKARGFISDLENLYPSPPSGDWLTSTMCYCHAPVHVDEISMYEKAHIFQHEYYNFHSNSTFILDHICLSHARFERDQCVRPNIGGDNNDWIGDYSGTYVHSGLYVCKKFPRTKDENTRQGNSNTKRSMRMNRRKIPHWPHLPTCYGHCPPGPFDEPEEQSFHPDHDKVCFAVDTNFYGPKKMEVKFNRQRREMSKDGHQGRIQTPFEEIQDICEDVCQSRFQMPADMEIDDKRAEGGSRQYIYTDMDDMCDHCK